MTRDLLIGALAGLLLAGCNTGSRGGASSTTAGATSATTATTGGGTAGGGTVGTTPSPTFPGLGSGTTYYVSPTGDDANPGTAAQPWQTVDRIETATLAPGDRVRIRAGTYDLNTSLRLENVRGSATAWIAIEADGGPVVLRNAAVANVVSVRGCEYLLLRGLTITHDNGGAAYGSWDAVDGIKFETADSHDVAIDACTITDVGNVGISAQVGEVRALQVTRTEIARCYTGIYWGYYEAANKRYAHASRIANNYIHDCPPVDLDGTGYGIQIKGGSRGNLIEDNVLVNVAGSTRAAIAVYHASTDQLTISAASDRNRIRRNYVRASRGEGIYAAEGATIEDNLLVDCRSGSLTLNRRDSGGWGVFYGNLTVRHNTIVSVRDAAGRGIFVGDAAFSGTFVLANNHVEVSGGSQLALRGPGAFAGTGSQNHCLGGSQGGGLGVVALAGTALRSTTPGDANYLRPVTGSPIVDAADPSHRSASGYHGTTRALRPDVGAFEGPVTAAAPADGFKP